MLNESELLAHYDEQVENLLSFSTTFNSAVKAELKEKLLPKGKDQEDLATQAQKRREETGITALTVRASLEFSNVCRQKCSFCGMTALNKDLERYRMTETQISHSDFAAI